MQTALHRNFAVVGQSTGDVVAHFASEDEEPRSAATPDQVRG